MLDMLKGEFVTIKTTIEVQDEESGAVGAHGYQGTLVGSDDRYVYIGNNGEMKPAVAIPHNFIMSIEAGNTIPDDELELGEMPDTDSVN